MEGRWWSGLDSRLRAAAIIAAIILPLLCCVGLVVAGAIGDQLEGGEESPTTSTVSPTPTATASPSPVVETRTVTESEAIPFEEETVEDPTLPEGTEEVRTEGEEGERILTYEVTYVDGDEADRELVDEEVAEEPVARVVVVGTGTESPPEESEPEPDPECDPNYSGACVPVASDVDCADGSGDGPAYVRGPVRVVGDDVYGLDRDGDGVACE